MCRSVDHWTVVLLLSWLATAIHAGILQRRFSLRLREQQPAVWRDLATWHKWNENSGLHESAVFSYLFQGLYRALPEESLVLLGGRAHKWMLVSIGVFFVYGSVVAIGQAGLVPSCYWR